MIFRHGGNPDKRMGADGSRNGRPLEVKSVRKDKRFRINRKPHRRMVRTDGHYILVDNGRSKVVPASRVSELIGRGKWLKDRKYPHKFLDKKKIFR